MSSAEYITPEIEQPAINSAEIIAALKRRHKILIAVSGAIFFAGVLLATVLPTIYRSEAVILIEQQEIPADLVRSTVTSFAAQRIQVMSQRVMSSSNLAEIIERYDLYTDERARDSREDVIENMRSNIGLEMISADVVDPKSGRPTAATIAFSLSFEDKSAAKAQQVANEIVTAFLSENIKSRTESAAQITTFLHDESEALKKRVGELEFAIAKFKDENANSRPELESLTRDLMNRTELHLGEVDRRIHEATQQKIYLEAELAQVDPILPETGLRGTTAFDQLNAVEANLAAAEASYGESHPDVIRLRNQAEALRATVNPNVTRVLYESQIAEARNSLNALLEQYGAPHPDAIRAQSRVNNLQRKIDGLPPYVEEKPNNPGYMALAARLEAAIAQLDSLEINRAQLARKLDELANSLMRIPDAEAEFRALTREYETTFAKYREVSDKKLEAEMSQNLESERKGEKFTLIEPPLLPERPAKPNRGAIIAIAFVLCVVGGLAAVRLVEALDDKIYGRRALMEILTVPPLATIPFIDVEQEPNTYRVIRKVGAVGVAAAVFAMVLMHLMVMPLDVLWFVILRKVGL